MAKTLLPFKQVIHPGDKGKDVLALKRAMLKMEAQDSDRLSVKGPKASIAGKAFVHVVSAMQVNHGYPPTGILGGRLYRIIAPHFDDYGRKLYGQAIIRVHPNVGPQARGLDYIRWAMEHRYLIGYSQSRPMHMATRHLPMNIDCSEFVTLTFKDAHLPDPNRNHFDGSGNTTSLRAHGTRVSGSAKVLDMAFYERPDHVGIYVHPGVIGRAQVAEHGSDPGPLYEPDDYRTIVEVRRYPFK